MQHLARSGLVIAAVAWLAQGRALADGFHCREQLVQTGDAPRTVAAKCGAPDEREPVWGSLCDEAGCCHVVQVGERWTYDFGSTRLVRHLVFRGDRLESVETGGYGGGKR